MPQSIHSQKIVTEKNYFVDELYNSILDKGSLLTGTASNNAKLLHKYYLAIYIMNHFCKIPFISDYFNYLMTSIIESESLLMLGFKNAAMTSLRSAVELSFKLLYFEHHPIELCLNNVGQFDLHSFEYREFMYRHPKASILGFNNKGQVERIWSDLCSFTHYDLKSVDTFSVISDIKPILSDTSSLNTLIQLIKESLRVIMINLFLVAPNWLEGVEKAYFDYPFEILYTPSEVTDLKINLRIV